MSRYPLPAEEIRREIMVINSRFIATLAPVFSVDEARAFTTRIRAEFADASHNVPAFLVGFGSSIIEHCSDDGEPSGTAGRPALAVLKGSGMGDAAVVVTRYFGGTKLGTGGLVRAYSEAVRTVTSQVRRAQKTLTHVVMLDLPYSLFEQVQLLVETHQGKTTERDFAAEITLTAHFAVERLDGFQQALAELSSGKLRAEIIETKEMLFPWEEEKN